MNSRLVWLAPVAVIAAIYAVTATPYLVGADNGEFVIIGALGGVPHPPGYPLYALLLGAVNALVSAPIKAASILTALIGTAAVGFVMAGAIGFGASRRSAAIAGVWYGLSTQVWYLHTHAEAFALNNLIAAAIVWASAPSSLRGGRRLLLLGLLAGLGISNHHSIVLLAPIGLWGAWQGFREAKHKFLALVGAVGLGFLGLTPYFWLLTQSGAEHPMVWGQIDNASALWAHFTRADYGTLTLDPNSGEPLPVAQLTEFVFRIVTDYHLVGFVAVLAGFRTLFRGEERASSLALLGAFLLAGPVFVGMFNIPPEGVGIEIVRRFHVLPETLLVVPLAFGVEAAFESLRKPLLIAVGAGVACVALAMGGLRVGSTYVPTIENYGSNVLRALPNDAVLLATGDAAYLGTLYSQLVDGERTDVRVVNPSLLRFDWYIERTERKLGHDLPEGPLNGRVRATDQAAVVDALLANHPAVFHVDPPAKLTEGRPTEPWGVTTRLMPRASQARAVCDVAADNEKLFEEFEFLPDPPLAENIWGRQLWGAYPRTWLRLREQLDKSGGACRGTIDAYIEKLHAE